MPLRLFRRKADGNFYIRGTVRGQDIYETTGTDDAAIAEAIRIRREADLLDRSVFGPGATVTFAEAAVSYLENGGEARFLGRRDAVTGKWSLLIGELGGTVVGKIGQHEIDTAARKLYPQASAATRKRQAYIPACAVLNHAAAKGWCGRPMIRHPRVKPPVTEYSTPERLGKLLGHCSPKLRRLVVTLTYTGARISELLRLDWDRDVDMANRTAILRRTKNGKARTVHLPDPVLIEFALVPERERHGQVFRWKARHAVYKPLRRACRLAGVTYLPTHQQGRHTFAAWLRIHAKRDLVGLKKDGGWDSIQSVMRYEHFLPGETATAVDKLPVITANQLTSKHGDSRKKLAAARRARWFKD